MKKARAVVFAESLALAMKFRGMTQAELARRAGSTRATICRLLHDRNLPSFDLLLRIEAVLPEVREHIKQGVSK